jgi:leucyl-tRNA synthetase
VVAVERRGGLHPGDRKSPAAWAEWYGDKQSGVCDNSVCGELDGLPYKAAVDRVAELLAAKGLGEKKTTFRLRDWGISRQRYWGTPIPIIHCDEHGAVPVPEKDLPVVLPEDCVPDGRATRCTSTRASTPVWTAPSAASPRGARPTPWTPSWTRPGISCAIATRPTPSHGRRCGADYWMPMDQYIGGIEHAILHLLYARFWTKVMRDLGLVKVDEPFTRC